MIKPPPRSFPVIQDADFEVVSTALQPIQAAQQPPEVRILTPAAFAVFMAGIVFALMGALMVFAIFTTILPVLGDLVVYAGALAGSVVLFALCMSLASKLCIVRKP